MKKILLSAAVALFATTASAVSVEDLRIYINPGHGSWTSNDRPCGTVKHGGYSQSDTVDTTGFFETNTNLQKGYALFHKLKEMGLVHNGENALDLTQNIVMSHIQAGPYPPYTWDATNEKWVVDSSTEFNRNLSEIAAEVEFNNFDMFIAIHSNAATEGTNTNYPLIIYRGTDAQEGNAGSIAMGKAVWPHLYGQGHHQWTYYSMTNTNVRGDHSFYGSTSNATYTIPEGSDYVYDDTDNFSQYIDGGDTVPDKVRYTGYLGVIKHGTPGFLSEGYFHTYQPARHRYMNDDVAHLEGYAYAYGVNDYFGLGYTESKAVIYGILRDKDARFSHEYYKPNVSTNDKFLPLNNADVALLNEAGDTVATYKTDDEYNGAFVFHVEPGTYSLTYSLDGYFAPDAEYTAQFTVAAGDKYYPEAFLRDTTWTPPTIVYVNYPDSTAGKGYTLLPKYETKATAYDMLATQLADKVVRRQIIREDKLYVLALDTVNANEPYIYLADLANDTIIELDKAAIKLSSAQTHALSDIALTADHVLVGCSYGKATYATGDDASNTIYKWVNNETTGLPETCEVWFTSERYGNCTTGYVGKTIAYSGTLENGMLVRSVNHSGGKALRFEAAAIVDGVCSADQYWVKTLSPTPSMPLADFGDDYQIMVSPLYDELESLSYHNFVIDGTAGAALEWTSAGDAADVTKNGMISTDLVDAKSSGANYFKYADKSLMVTPKIDADGKVCGVQLLDITDGFSNAKEVAVDAAIDPVDYTYASAHGELALTLSADDRTTGATIELFLAVDGKVTKFTVGDFYTSVAPASGGVANPFAYALKGEVTEGEKLSVSYSLNAAATDVNIYVIDENDDVVASYEAGALAAGDYTAEIDLMNLEEGKYTWEIEVAGETATTVKEFASWDFYHPSGMDVDNSFESASFGTLFVCEGYNRGNTAKSSGAAYISANGGNYGGGLYIFNPKGEQVLNKDGGARFYPSFLTCTDRTFSGVDADGAAATHNNGADFARVAVAEDGRIFVNRYNTAGDYYLYAQSLEDLVATGEFTSLLAGKTMTDAIYYDASGNYLAGPAQAFDVIGSGEDLKLVAISRKTNSISTGTSLNLAVEYALGTSSVLPTPTYVDAFNGKYTISRDRSANIQFDNEGGIWYVQYRGTPNNSEPALVYVNAAGEIKYFEGAGGKVRRNAGLSVSPDGKFLAVPSASGTVSVYEIIRLEDGSIYLNEEYKITGVGSNEYSLAWDAAGNLYGGNATNEFVKGYALPRTEPFTTKAASKYSFVKTADGLVGVEGVEVDANAPVKYYNLQGIEVNADNLNNGIYIKVQGKKSSKIYVK